MGLGLRRLPYDGQDSGWAWSGDGRVQPGPAPGRRPGPQPSPGAVPKGYVTVAAKRPSDIRERDQTWDVPALYVRRADGSIQQFFETFHIGRDQDCEVQVQDVHVSRRHAQVSFAAGRWTIRDLQSRNGLLIDGEKVDEAPIGEGVSITLGEDGPSLELGSRLAALAVPEGSHRGDEPSEDDMLEGYMDRYCREDSSEDAGGRTIMIRRAIQKFQQKQRRKYRWIISVVAAAGMVAAGYAYYNYLLLDQIAKNNFYNMKEKDVLIAEAEERVAETGDPKSRELLERYMKERREMEANYEQYFRKVYDRRLSPKDRLILKVTRLFGECELTAPPEYLGEVSRYIEKWRSTPRFEEAVKRAQVRGYTKRIATAFTARQLPAQYFYLAMQESNFEPTRSGPWTKWGHAKGMWQFIPDTGKRYGLNIGPGSQTGQFDPLDERFDWERATAAAARYIKDIYATDAEASGLLVMASYNWGEHRVIDIVRKMPRNPKERNFWRLLADYRVPQQTYDYVFYIVSAAVIGENPRLFGFQFDNPLAEYTAAH
jgi:membrane-bound lytic murein transglycosylase D